MHGGAVVGNVVLDVYDDPVTPIGLDGWAWRCAIEDEHLALVAIWGCDHFLGSEPVLQSCQTTIYRRIIEVPLILTSRVTPVSGVTVA